VGQKGREEGRKEIKGRGGGGRAAPSEPLLVSLNGSLTGGLEELVKG
jgi:hypothetical protein